MISTVDNNFCRAGSKPRYDLLDGLRGVAAFMVILYHVGECFASSPVDQIFNHGYLAVDFFFVLSGFVIGYAYDDSWKRGMTARQFLMKRVVRLQPMVVAGVVLGVIAFMIQGCEKWDGSSVSVPAVMLSLLLGLFMIPSLPGTLPEIRGNGEMFPLNGPSWSLFFEYMGSIFYALFLHRFSTRALAVFTALSGCLLAGIALFNCSGAYHLGVGWTAADGGWWMGLVRMTFSFSAGMLLSRCFKPVHIRGAFWICSALIVVLLAAPYAGSATRVSIINGIYDTVCTLVLFPLIVYIGASGRCTDSRSQSICSTLGVLSYPVYIIHYPFMYLMYSWAWSNGLSVTQVLPVAVTIVIVAPLLAWLLAKYYDTPVRRYLNSRMKL
ncbi:MAG: acyltransferase [Clostridiales bacterium]|nr:acyltransferase [Clostridiales bacterium]